MRNINEELLRELGSRDGISLSEIAEKYFFTKLNRVSRRAILDYLENEGCLEISGDIVRPKERDRLAPGQLIEKTEFAFIDTETNFKNIRAVEIGIVVSRGSAEAGRFSTLLNPMAAVDRETLELTGINEEDIRKAPTFEEAWVEIEPLLRGKVIAAHNLPFDRGVLMNELGRARARLVPRMPALCTLKLARALLKREAHSLDALALRFGLNAEIRHRALPDGVLAFRLLFRLIRYAGEEKSLEIKTLGDLEKLGAIYR